MQHPIAVLSPETAGLLARLVITRPHEVDAAAKKLLAFIDAGRYGDALARTGVPLIFEASSFERESSSNFTKQAGQGWPLASKSQWIPHIGPFATWADSAVAAYAIDHLNTVGAGNWTWLLFCYYGEALNGFGYRAHGVHTPYLYAGSNIYDDGPPGRYAGDGNFVRERDTQLGIVPIARRMVELRAELDLPGWPTVTTGVVPAPMPAPMGVGDMSPQHTAEGLQRALNELHAAGVFVFDDAIAVDGNIGRETMAAVRAFQAKEGLEVDGLAGPKTWNAIAAVLHQLHGGE